MAIIFSIGDYVIPNEAHISGIIKQATIVSPLINQALETLGNITGVPCRVVAKGNLTYPVRSYVGLLPTDTRSIAYNSGKGVVLYFSSDTEINNSLEYSTGYLRDKCFIQALNDSGGGVTKGQLVRQVGFDTTTQLATIDLADATVETNAVVLGAAMEDIADGSVGSILTEGSLDADTSGFTAINDTVYLSDTPGEISTAVGTIEIAVGRVLAVGTTGSITLISTSTGAGGATPGTGKQTIWVPAAAMTPTVTAGAAALTSVETTAGNPNLIVLDFDASADEHVQFQVAFPKQWDKSSITYQAFWTLSAANTSGVAWALQAVAVSNDETIDVAYGTPVVVVDNNLGTSNDQLVTAESGLLTIAGTPADDDMIYFQGFRDVSDAGDDATEDGRLIGFKLFFTNIRTTDN